MTQTISAPRRITGNKHEVVLIRDLGLGWKANVDTGIADDVLLLWRNGVETIFSCEDLFRVKGSLGKQVVVPKRHLADAVELLDWADFGDLNFCDYVSLTEREDDRDDTGNWRPVWARERMTP